MSVNPDQRETAVDRLRKAAQHIASMHITGASRDDVLKETEDAIAFANESRDALQASLDKLSLAIEKTTELYEFVSR